MTKAEDIRFKSDEYHIIAGPTSQYEPINSMDVHQIAAYPVSEVLDTLLAQPRIRLLTNGEVGWRGWEAIWESGQDLILFEKVEEFLDEGHFAGIQMSCDCSVMDVYEISKALRQKHEGLWLFNAESWLVTPESFLAGWTFSDSWRTEHTIGLASQMYESRNFTTMPFLADALEEAGCDNSDILLHCRGDGPHVRGCWVVDLVLGKE